MSEATVSMFHPKKILVPIDFSPSSIAALATASQMAQQFHAKLCLLHVIPMLPIVSGLEFPTAFYPRQEFLADAEEDSAKRFVDLVDHLAGQGVEATFKVEIGNDVVGNVLMVLEREHADLLVISTQGMSGWRPVVFGSIAEKVVKLAECPVLLLRTAKTTVELKPRVKQ
ncbi:UspA domain-containing protein (plasmid) [Granulicella tundricola MP5ACTX9]|uniref:UspA domain-containing protein n=2 Tax=Granulicella TaxID=940557 RepID=E8X7D2_GRATM|nr:UspA domain-containing protein [Granulicella tundricola MP5ACTX9]